MGWVGFGAKILGWIGFEKVTRVQLWAYHINHSMKCHDI